MSGSVDIQARTAAPPSASRSLSELEAELALLRAEPSARAAFDRFAATMGGLGFADVFAGRLSLALLTEFEPEPFAFVNSDEPFIDHYLSAGFYAHDPICAHMRRTSRPFRWREAMGALTPEAAHVVELFAEAGLTHGLCVPIDAVGGVHGFVTLGRNSDFALPPEALIVIEMHARTLFATVDRLRREADSALRRLTSREVDVLVLVAQGRTNREIGEALGLSPYSVRDLMQILSERLQTDNRTHTVVRAVQLGLIAV